MARATEAPPVSSPGGLETAEDTAANGTLEATDPNSDPLIFSIVSNGTLGTAVVTDVATGAYTYTPNTNATGIDAFTFKASDGSQDSATETVTVTITAVNDAPFVAVPISDVAVPQDSADTGQDRRPYDRRG